MSYFQQNSLQRDRGDLSIRTDALVIEGYIEEILEEILTLQTIMRFQG